MKKILSMILVLNVGVLLFSNGNSETKTSAYQYTDAAGRTVSLDKYPERVAVTYLPLWETLIMLDIKPIAAGGAENYIATWEPFTNIDTEGIVDIGNKEVNLELLIDLEPDLILDQAWDISNVDVANLEKVAPVAVFGSKTKMDWRLSLREVGKLMQREEKAEEVIVEVEKSITEAREKLQANYNQETAIVVTMMGADRFVLAYRPDFYDKEIGLGLNLPEGFTDSKEYLQLSMESLVEMNPDNLFINVFAGDESVFKEVSENPVWKSLKAVKNNKLFIGSGAGHAASPLSTVHTINFIVDSLL